MFNWYFIITNKFNIHQKQLKDRNFLSFGHLTFKKQEQDLQIIQKWAAYVILTRSYWENTSFSCFQVKHSLVTCQPRKYMQLLTSLRYTTYTCKKIKMESQAKLTNLVISYSPDILNISKKFKQIKISYLKEGNSIQYYGTVKLSY